MNTVAVILAAAALGWGSALLIMPPKPADPMLQANFPCQEDEALQFSPADTERLVCVPLK